MTSHPLLVLLALATLLTGCQTTSIRSAWFDTNFAGPAFRKILIVSDVGTTSDSRVFEDTFAERLRATGVETLAGHTVRIDDARMPEAAFIAAVVGSGAQGLLVVRLLGVDTRTRVTTTMVPGGMGWGRSPWGISEPMRVPVQQVSQYDLAVVESKLFDVQTKQVVWAATTTTFNPRSLARETPPFADLLIGQWIERGIIAGK